MQNLATSCTCKECQRTSRSTRNVLVVPRQCKKSPFLSRVSIYIADILAISLFESPETLLISSGSHVRRHQRSKFIQKIFNINTSGEPAVCPHHEILSYALELVGHTMPDSEKWIISCYKGQAVYPRVFKTGNLCQPGFLALYWAPGSLLFDGEVYDRGIGSVDMSLDTNLVTTEIPTVTESLNLYPNLKMEWKVVRCDGYLEIHPTYRGLYGHATSILSNLANAQIVVCPHDRALLLHRPDPSSRYIDLFSLPKHDSMNSVTKGQVDILATDGNTDLRMFVLSVFSVYRNPWPPVVIRDNACLQCCIDLCREVGYSCVVC